MHLLITHYTLLISVIPTFEQTLKGFQGPSGAELEEEAEPACYDVKLLFGPLLSSINSSGKGGPGDVPVTEVMVQGRLEVMILPDLAVAALPQDFNEVECGEVICTLCVYSFYR